MGAFTSLGEAFSSGRTSGKALRAAIAPTADSTPTPKNHWDAVKLDELGWTTAESKEFTNHRTNQSWEVIARSELPRGRKLVKMTWVYKVKRDGTLKARLCVQGCTQIAGVDYGETFCSTMRGSTLRSVCAAAAKWDLHMRRWDFVAAYLQGQLDEGETVYCSLPPGYPNEKTADGQPAIYKIKKPVYGMAQAGRRWQRSLFPWLKEIGFTQHESDDCLFSKVETRTTPQGPREERLILGCYVDDLFTAYTHDDEHSLYHDFTRALQKRWEVEDEGVVKDLLAVEIERDGKQVCLHQRGYIEHMMDDHLPGGRPQHLASTKTPCDDSLPRLVLEAQDLDMATIDATLLQEYQSLVGALLYCSGNTRPDAAYAVGMLCRVSARPTLELLDAARRVLCYLDRTKTLGLCYEADSGNLHGACDSDWAVKHSTSGWVFKYCRAAISWSSKKQKTVALSSCEAEIMAASEASKEAIYLGGHLTEMGLHNGSAIELGCDNQAAIALAHNPEHHDKTKHIKRRHFFVREAVENEEIIVPYVRTVDNFADFFTKPIVGHNFFRMRDTIMNCDSRASKQAGRAMIMRTASECSPCVPPDGDKVSRRWTRAQLAAGSAPYPTHDPRWCEVTASWHVSRRSERDRENACAMTCIHDYGHALLARVAARRDPPPSDGGALGRDDSSTGAS